MLSCYIIGRPKLSNMAFLSLLTRADGSKRARGGGAYVTNAIKRPSPIGSFLSIGRFGIILSL